jgi:hypothetical protein
LIVGLKSKGFWYKVLAVIISPPVSCLINAAENCLFRSVSDELTNLLLSSLAMLYEPDSNLLAVKAVEGIKEGLKELEILTPEEVVADDSEI